jgi:hypothetical protein
MKRVTGAGFLAALLVATALPSILFGQAMEEGREESPKEGSSPPPALPVQLILDDGSREGSFGIAGARRRQFLWFNQLSRPAGVEAMALEEIWVLFPPELDLEKGAPVELVVYLDPNGDPTDGADLLATFEATVQIVDGLKFSVYPLPEPLDIVGSGDILIGVVNRFEMAGVSDLPISPAAIDTANSNQRSWIALWQGDPPSSPNLPPDLSLRRLNLTTPGTFMIRGFGRPVEIPEMSEIPVLGRGGLALLALLLSLLGLRFLARP